jgi:hypothetical protein
VDEPQASHRPTIYAPSGHTYFHAT